MKFETLTVHAGQTPDPAYGAVMQPIYQVSTFAYKDVKQAGTFDYSRSGNPTRKALEDCVAVFLKRLARLCFCHRNGSRNHCHRSVIGWRPYHRA
jgi:cystathionine beta-lyase/cystathionine gamma-synthase